MKAVGDRYRVDRVVVEGDRLGDPVADALGADRGGERRSHRLLRLDRDDVKAELEQTPRQLARAGGEVEHPSPRAHPELGRERSDRGGRVLRPTALVRSGDAVEVRGERVQLHAKRLALAVRCGERRLEGKREVRGGRAQPGPGWPGLNRAADRPESGQTAAQFAPTQRIRGIALSAVSPTCSRLAGQTLSSVSAGVCQ